MINKNDFKVYRKYEGDKRKYTYNYDMIIERIMEIVESLDIEDRLKEYIEDLEYITEQIVDELNETNSDLNNLQYNYNDLKEEKEELIERIEELEERVEG